MVQNILSYGDEFHPIVPLADGVLDFAKSVNESLIARVIGQLEYIAKLLDLETVGMKIVFVERWRIFQFGGQLEGGCCCFGRDFGRAIRRFSPVAIFFVGDE